MKSKFLISIFLFMTASANQLKVGGKLINTGHRLELLSKSKESITQLRTKIEALKRKNQSLLKIKKENKESYLENVQQLDTINNLITINQEKVKTLRFQLTSGVFSNEKTDKNLVSGFASFLEKCNQDLSDCKSKKLVECKATYKNKTIFKTMTTSKYSCLDKRKDLLKSQKLSVISSGSFLKDIEIEKLVTYHYADESFLLTEVNNCVAISTTQGHDRTLHNTHASSKEECIRQCLSLYQKKLIGHPNSALTCTLWWTNEDPVIAHIFKKKSPIGKIWSDTKLNDNNFKNVVIYNPRFDNKGEFQGF